ncbi:MAG: glycosyltransferase family 2 protein [Candidatus Kapaibacterium sp.]
MAPKTNIKFSVVVISYNTRDLTANCVRSILDSYPPDELIVIDNASSDDTVENLQNNFPSVNIIVNKKNLGYAAAVNLGAALVSNEYMILSNSDVDYHPGTTKKLIEFISKSDEIGVCGPQQVYPDGNWQYSHGRLPGVINGIEDLFFITTLSKIIRRFSYRFFPLEKFPKDTGYIDGAVICTRKSAFDKLGGFDEDFFFYSEEADYCYRLKKAGYAVLFYPKATVTHHRGASSSGKIPNRGKLRQLIASKVLFCEKHKTKAEKRIFVLFEYIHNKIMSMLWALVYKSNKNEKNRIKYIYHYIANELWREKLKS